MKFLFRHALSATLALALGSAPALAAPPEGKGKPDKHQGHGKPQKHGQPGRPDSGYDSADAARDLVRAGITAAAVRAIIGERHLDLGGYAALPPGIRKNLARGKPLPPGIARKAVPAPLLGELPKYPGYEWQVAGRDLVLVAIGSMLVADVLSGVFD
ncbi:anti-virulence regulator CigR family protein [Crenobacter intestini]|uniref:RcnB family protein n=1 Tax=Crenobacter intestini TaxID=2563443 RepID=A0A4T0UQM3_9NEIS|nr:anti-virulence regulator CigR family protein [Crenobacter intestini]TIC81158.1 hypothetical protein E5K04_11250 [Crenobacter intestini]